MRNKIHYLDSAISDLEHAQKLLKCEPATMFMMKETIDRAAHTAMKNALENLYKYMLANPKSYNGKKDDPKSYNGKKDEEDTNNDNRTEP